MIGLELKKSDRREGREGVKEGSKRAIGESVSGRMAEHE